MSKDWHEHRNTLCLFVTPSLNLIDRIVSHAYIELVVPIARVAVITVSLAAVAANGSSLSYLHVLAAHVSSKLCCFLLLVVVSVQHLLYFPVPGRKSEAQWEPAVGVSAALSRQALPPKSTSCRVTSRRNECRGCINSSVFSCVPAV